MSKKTNLAKTLTPTETWGFGLAGHIGSIISIPAITVALGEGSIYIWFPLMIMAMITCFQVQKLGQIWPNISGSIPGYIIKLLPEQKPLALYSAIGYLLGWSMALTIYARLIVEAIITNFGALPILPPEIIMVIFFTIIGFIIGFTSIRSISLLNTVLIFPTALLLISFGIIGGGWLIFSPASPGFFPQNIPSINLVDIIPWLFFMTYTTMVLDTEAVFTGDSKNPKKTLSFLTISAILAPFVHLLNPWIVTRLASNSDPNLVFDTIASSAIPFLGENYGVIFVTSLIVLCSLLSAAASVTICSRVIYQFSKEKLFHPIFSITNDHGVIPYSLFLTMIIGLSTLIYNNINDVVLVAGVANLFCYVMFNFAIWKNRKKLNIYPKLSFIMFISLLAMLVIGGIMVNPLGLAVGMLMPAYPILLNKIPKRLYDKIYQRKFNIFTRNLNFTLVQIMTILAIICITVLTSYSLAIEYGNSDQASLLNSFTTLFWILSFIGIGIAAWTVIPQINTINKTKNELSITNEKLIQDIQKRQELETTLKHNLIHDNLTGLGNRQLLSNKMSQIISEKNYNYSLLFIDLDRFKTVNDFHGHKIGDALLKKVAKKLSKLSKTNHTIIRISGDEFVILLENISNTQESITLCKKILKKLEKPIKINKRDLIISCSIGVAFGSPRYKKADDVIRDADIAMYESKLSGRNTFTLFTDYMHEKTVENHKLEILLRNSIKNNNLELEFQPINNIPDLKTVGFEALLRLNDSGKIIYPNKFINLAEETGLIIPLTEWVINQTCKQIKSWNKSTKNKNYYVSINFSELMLSYSNLKSVIKNALNKHKINPKQLKVELLEHSAMNNSAIARQNIRILENCNIDIIIDDFGIGYSNLSYLHNLPISKLKIDKSFVKNIDKKGLKIIKTIVQLAKTLDIETIIEGVETEKEFQKILSAKCDFIQGYYLSKPLKQKLAEKFLKNVNQKLCNNHS